MGCSECVPRPQHSTHPRQAPHLNAWINCLRAGLFSILAWISVTLMCLSYSVNWIADGTSGSHAHYTWDRWSTRWAWTMVGCVVALTGALLPWFAAGRP
jgi:hypothetical protein